VRHLSSEDLWVDSRNLEGTLFPLKVKCVDGILQVMVPRAVPAHQCLPSYGCHCLYTSRTRGGTSMIADHLLPIEDLNVAGELHVPRPWDTLDPVFWALVIPSPNNRPRRCMGTVGDSSPYRRNSVATQMSCLVFMPKPSTHRMYDPGSIVPHIWTKSVHI
jgi:hypothetical protein